MRNKGFDIGNIEVMDGTLLPEMGQKMAFSTEVYILIRERSLSLMALNNSEGRTALFLSSFDLELPLTEGLKKAFFEHPILSLPFRNTHLYIDQGSYALLPTAVDGSGTPELWSELCGKSDDREVLTLPLLGEQMVLHYTVPMEVYRFCQRSFSLPSYGHVLQPLIATSIQLSRQSEPALVMMRKSGEYADVIYAADGQLQLANRYRVMSDEDVMYYITALYRQFYLSSQSVPLYLYSEELPDKMGVLVEKLSEFIGRVEINKYHSAIFPDEKIKAEYADVLVPEFILTLLCE